MVKLRKKRGYVNPSDVADFTSEASEAGFDMSTPSVEITDNRAKDKLRDSQREYGQNIRTNRGGSGTASEGLRFKRNPNADLEPIELPQPETPIMPETKNDMTDNKPSAILPAVILPPPPGRNGERESFSDKLKEKITGGYDKAKEAAGKAKETAGKAGEKAKDIFGKTVKLNNRYTVGGDRTKTTDESNKGTDEFDRNPQGMSDTQADMYASLCGYTKSIKVLRSEYNELKNRASRIGSEHESYTQSKEKNKFRMVQVATERDSVKSELDGEKDRLNYMIAGKSDEDQLNEQREKINALSRKLVGLKSEYNQLEDEVNRTGAEFRYTQKEQSVMNQLESLRGEFSKYYMAVSCGQEKYKKSHGWRTEWAKPLGENTSEMLNPVNINDPSTIVGYGGMTGKSAVSGINAITGGYRVNDTANSWTRTNVGDRQLVEALVNVRPNRMITPFGAPGTVGESNLQHQFQYNTPLRRIGVGDVTARGGYQLRLEDIHRRKKLSKPKIVRKKVIEKKPLGNNRALNDAISLVGGQKLIDIKAPSMEFNKGVKVANSDQTIRGAVTLNYMKDMTLSKSSMNIELAGINSIMKKAVTATKKTKKVKA